MASRRLSQLACSSVVTNAAKSCDPPQILFRIHAHRVERSLGHVDCDAMVEKPQLLQSLAALQFRLRPGAERVEGGLAIGVEAEVLVVPLPVRASRSKGIVAREK